MAQRGAQRGFTLLEILAVVTVVGILGALAVPAFTKQLCKAKQLEARTTLRAIYGTEMAYRGEFGAYANLTQLTTKGQLPPKLVSSAVHYEYTITVTSSSFTAVAQDTKLRINNRTTSDLWRVTNLPNSLVVTTTACR